MAAAAWAMMAARWLSGIGRLLAGERYPVGVPGGIISGRRGRVGDGGADLGQQLRSQVPQRQQRGVVELSDQADGVVALAAQAVAGARGKGAEGGVDRDLG